METEEIDSWWQSGRALADFRRYLPESCEDVEDDVLVPIIDEWEDLYSPDFGVDEGYSRAQFEELAKIVESKLALTSVC